MFSHEVDTEPVSDDAASKPAAESERPEPASRPTERPDPTRYGDWEKDGRCIDF